MPGTAMDSVAALVLGMAGVLVQLFIPAKGRK
jgi:hypothetical protein